MKKERIFVLLLVLIVSGAFVLSVYFAYEPGYTQIELGKGGEQNNGYQENDEGSRHNVNYRNTEQSNVSDAERNTESVISVPGEEPTYVPDEENCINLHDLDDGKSENPAFSSKENQDYTLPILMASQLETDYHITLLLCTPETPNDMGTAFSDSDTALDSVKLLRSALRRGGKDLFEGFYQKGYRITVILGSSATTASFVSSSESGEMISIEIISGNLTWEQDFCSEYVRLAEAIIRSNADTAELDRCYRSLNPDGFCYGTPAFEYISSEVSSTYFLGVIGQRSLADDRRSLYTAYLMDAIPSKYLTDSCPLYQKIQMIRKNMSDYVLC